MNNLPETLKENFALKAEIANLKKEVTKLKCCHAKLSDALHNILMAMQAAVIGADLQGLDAGFAWIHNTLEASGCIPDVNEAKAMGGAQAWFDAEKAKEVARLSALGAAS